MQPSRREIDRDHAAAGTVFHDQVDREVLDVELRIMLQRLLIERVQHGVARTVRRSTGALRRALAKARCHATERTLVNLALFGARKRHAVVLELDDGVRRFLAHVLNRILVAKPVGALDGVVHVPAPIVLAHVAKRRTDTALRRDRVAACGKTLVIQAVLKPASARPNVARNPAPPAPMTTTS